MSVRSLGYATGPVDASQWVGVAFVVSYSSAGTRRAYATQLRLWFDRC